MLIFLWTFAISKLDELGVLVYDPLGKTSWNPCIKISSIVYQLCWLVFLCSMPNPPVHAIFPPANVVMHFRVPSQVDRHWYY